MNAPKKIGMNITKGKSELLEEELVLGSTDPIKNTRINVTTPINNRKIPIKI
jgi:hypothetical protein